MLSYVVEISFKKGAGTTSKLFVTDIKRKRETKN